MTRVVLLYFSILTLAGASACTQDPAPKEKAEAAGDKAMLRPAGGDLQTINPCTGIADPTRAFVLRIDDFNVYDIKDRFIQKPVLRLPNGKFDEAAGDGLAQPVLPEPKADKGTPIDINLKLAPGESVLIKIHLRKAGLSFMDKRDDGAVMAITAGDSRGKLMLCNAERVSETVATVIAHHGGLNSGQYGGYNIGVVVTQPGGLVLPVHVDPNIRNDG